MNRFAVYTIMALAALAVAHSAPVDDEFNEAATQASLTTTPAEETAELASKGLQAFAPFCINARDHIYADIKAKAGTLSSRGFSFIFSMADDFARKAMEVNADATERLGNQLANPSAEVEGDDDVASAQREIANQNQPKALLTAFTSAIAANAQAFVKVFKAKSAQVKDFADPRVLLDIAEFGCRQINKYELTIREMFDEFKKNVPEKYQAETRDVRFETVPCVTVKRITRVDGFCSLVNSSYEPFLKFLGIAPKN